MDTIENLIIAIVKPLISQPDALTIKIEDTPEFLENLDTVWNSTFFLRLLQSLSE